MDDMREQALAYAKRGWCVFPLRPRSKKPLTSNGLNAATTNQLTIERWWDRYPAANIGLRTGAGMKVWVLDVDGAVGSASLTELENDLGVLPETLDQQTGGGGRQLLFAWPEGREIRNRSNVRPGIDVRGEGGYIVAPPSIHPSGTPYSWPTGDRGRIAQAPKAWLDLVCPPPAPQSAPWERVGPLRRPPPLVINTPILKRASLYLAECAPAVQGSGGHNALLWAARALVIGLELGDSEAIGLLWSEFNPRCTPSWRQDVEADRREFERKVSEARRTPGEKRRGWLLDELGLRDSMETLKQIASGRDFAQGLLSSAVKRAQANPAEPRMDEDEVELPEVGDRQPFPVGKFPAQVADFLFQVAESHQVDLSFAALPALAVAGAAMGNAWRLQLKKGFQVPPTLWVGLVASSGTNKSGPLREVIAPLHVPVPMHMVGNPMLNPQQEMVVGDATVEAVISHLSENPRGVLVFRDELAGWCNGFNAYKSKGGDEQAWLEFWGAGAYSVSRKTNNERIRIPAAATCVLGGIQPSILASCFDPAHFASGLVPRILIACPPRRQMFWTEEEVSTGAEMDWADAIMWIRSRPFAALDPNTSTYSPHILQLSPESKARYVTFFDALSLEIDDTTDENCRAFMSKGRLIAARLALIHHGLAQGCKGGAGLELEVQPESVLAGVAWARWCLEEQIRVYGFGSTLQKADQALTLVRSIRQRLPTATATVRQIQRLNQKRFRTAQIALAAMEQLVELRHARWSDEQHKQITLLGGEEK